MAQEGCQLEQGVSSIIAMNDILKLEKANNGTN